MAKTIVIFPGGFHPPHAGHVASFNALKDAFPGSEAFMVSTGYTAERPFPFEKKKTLAIAAGIPENSFVEVKSPYVAIEVTKKFDKEKDFLVFGVSEKDADRFTYTKKDGSPGYFQKWTPDVEMVPFAKHAYIYITPILEFKVAGKIVTSASAIRKMYKDADEKTKKIILKDLYPNANLEDVKDLFDEVLKEVYMPKKYRVGLSKSTAGNRKRFWVKLGNYPYTKAEYSKAEKVPGDAKSETRPSQYNKKYQQMFGESRSIKALQKKAKATGIPYGILKQVYNRGMAAWVTGHRPGASQSAWAFARVNSFVTKGKTWKTADADLAKKARRFLKEDWKLSYYKSGYITPSGKVINGNHDAIAKANNLTRKLALEKGWIRFYITTSGEAAYNFKSGRDDRANSIRYIKKHIENNASKINKIIIDSPDISNFTKDKIKNWASWLTGKNLEEAHIFPQYYKWGWIDPKGNIHNPIETDKTHIAILRRLAEEDPSLNLSENETESSATRKGWIRWLVEYQAKDKQYVVFFNTTKVNKLIKVYSSIERIVTENKDASFFNFLYTGYKYIQSLKYRDFISKIKQLFGVDESHLEKQDMDYEIEMASGQLKKIIDLATNTLNYIQNESQLDSWIQDKISVSAHNMEAIYDYFHYSEEKIEEKIVKKDKKYYLLSKKTGKNLGGPYDTKEKAGQRERQVQFFNHLNK